MNTKYYYLYKKYKSKYLEIKKQRLIRIQHGGGAWQRFMDWLWPQQISSKKEFTEITQLVTEQETLVEKYDNTDLLVYNKGYVRKQSNRLEKYNELLQTIKRGLNNSDGEIQGHAMTLIDKMVNLLKDFKPLGIVKRDESTVDYVSQWFSNLTKILQDIRKKLNNMSISGNTKATHVKDNIIKIMNVVEGNIVPLELEVDKITHAYIMMWIGQGEMKSYIDHVVEEGKDKDKRRENYDILVGIKDVVSEQLGNKINKLTHSIGNASDYSSLGGSDLNKGNNDSLLSFNNLYSDNKYHAPIARLMMLAEQNPHIISYVISKLKKIKTIITDLLHDMETILYIFRIVDDSQQLLKDWDKEYALTVVLEKITLPGEVKRTKWEEEYFSKWKDINDYLEIVVNYFSADFNMQSYSSSSSGRVLQAAVQAFNTMTIDAGSRFNTESWKDRNGFFLWGIKAIRYIKYQLMIHSTHEELKKSGLYSTLAETMKMLDRDLRSKWLDYISNPFDK